MAEEEESPSSSLVEPMSNKSEIVIFYEPPNGPLRFFLNCEGEFISQFINIDTQIKIQLTIFFGKITKVYFIPEFVNQSKFFFMNTRDHEYKKELVQRLSISKNLSNLEIDDFLTFQYEGYFFYDSSLDKK